MRIIAGKCRGRRLKGVQGFNTRPTADKVKEAIFNVLAHRVVDAKVLDLFGGTGNMGLEALSRGAAAVVFVENNAEAIKVLQENIKQCGFEQNTKIYPDDAFKMIDVLKKNAERFNLIYLDPPYKLDVLDSLIDKIFVAELLEVNGIIVIESDKKTILQESYQRLLKVKDSTYGDTKITYYQIKEED